MKVVLDANLFISFLLTKGETLTSLFNLWKEKRFTLLVTDEIIVEITQITERFVARKLIYPEDGRSLTRRLKRKGEKIVSSSRIDISPDKKDNRYLVCALDGKADYLITGDKRHLLPLKKIGKTKIVSPKEFLTLLELKR